MATAASRAFACRDINPCAVTFRAATGCMRPLMASEVTQKGAAAAGRRVLKPSGLRLKLDDGARPGNDRVRLTDLGK